MRIPHEKELLKEIIDTCNPERVILFGSRAKGTFHTGSDIDIAVKGGKALSFREKRKLKEKLEHLAGLYTVDLLFYEEIGENLKEIIDRTGVVLWRR